MNGATIGVLLIDDHVVVREGLRALLERQEGVTVVAEAGSVDDAVALDVRADVVVADLMLPDERGPRWSAVSSNATRPPRSWCSRWWTTRRTCKCVSPPARAATS